MYSCDTTMRSPRTSSMSSSSAPSCPRPAYARSWPTSGPTSPRSAAPPRRALRPRGRARLRARAGHRAMAQPARPGPGRAAARRAARRPHRRADPPGARGSPPRPVARTRPAAPGPTRDHHQPAPHHADDRRRPVRPGRAPAPSASPPAWTATRALRSSRAAAPPSWPEHPIALTDPAPEPLTNVTGPWRLMLEPAPAPIRD